MLLLAAFIAAGLLLGFKHVLMVQGGRREQAELSIPEFRPNRSDRLAQFVFFQNPRVSLGDSNHMAADRFCRPGHLNRFVQIPEWMKIGAIFSFDMERMNNADRHFSLFSHVQCSLLDSSAAS